MKKMQPKNVGGEIRFPVGFFKKHLFYKGKGQLPVTFKGLLNEHEALLCISEKSIMVSMPIFKKCKQLGKHK